MSRELLSPVAAGEALGIHPETVRRLYRSGRIPGYRVGRQIRLDLVEVRDALRTSGDAGNGQPAVRPNFDALDAA